MFNLEIQSTKIKNKKKTKCKLTHISKNHTQMYLMSAVAKNKQKKNKNKKKLNNKNEMKWETNSIQQMFSCKIPNARRKWEFAKSPKRKLNEITKSNIYSMNLKS